MASELPDRSLVMTRPLKLIELAPLIISSLLILSLFPLIYSLSHSSITLIDWVILPHSSLLSFTLIIDVTRTIFLSTVLLISSCVLFFSQSYMASDNSPARFTILVLLFVASMISLLLSPHGITLLLGWDGLGITSFLLIVFYQNPKSLAAGIITIIINRIGDVIILISISLILGAGHWNLIIPWIDNFHLPLTFLIITAAITKRAQIPFSRWLPAAMAAPTPVSALVHSSTLVTAGVYILIRFYPTLSHSNIFNFFLLLIATLTTLIARIAATREFDLKKIIALSTLSQLGIIILRLALKIPFLALFHLISHALFKALLFICAGTIIHLNNHNQDIRQLGSSWKTSPLTLIALNIRNLALTAFPFIAGFYSKDAIIEQLISTPTNFLLILLIIIATGLTTLYSIRLSYYTLWYHVGHQPIITLTEKNNTLLPSILPLLFGAILIGAIFTWLYPPQLIPLLPLPYKPAPLILSVCMVFRFIIINYYLYKPQHPILTHLPPTIWFIAPLTPLSSTPALKSRTLILNTMDRGWNKLLTARGTFFIFSYLASHQQNLQKNLINNFLALSFVSILIILYLC